MQPSNQPSPFLKRYASFVTIAILQLAVLIGLVYYYVPMPNTTAETSSVKLSTAAITKVMESVAVDKTAIYHLYDSKLNPPAKYSVESLGNEGAGTVVDAWDANTKATKRACQSLWLFDGAHETFCKSLHDTSILAIRESDMISGRIAYVPISKNIAVTIGDNVVFIRGRFGNNDYISAMPTLSVLNQKRITSK